VAIANSRVGAYAIQLTGAQAPVAVTSLNATPAAHGAIHLAWTPSASSGVSGYLLQRSNTVANSPFETIATLPATATSAVDQTTVDGTYAYQVVAVAPGATTLDPSVSSSPSPEATAVADTTAPAQPADVGSHAFINSDDAANGGGIGIPVDLAPSSSPADTVTVTLEDSTGRTISGQHIGGSPTVTVNVPNVGVLADGTITVSATTGDSLGNTSQAVPGPSIWKDTVAPPQPIVSIDPITGGDVGKVPVTVNTEPASKDGATVTVQLTDGVNSTQPVQQNENAGQTSITIPVDATSIPDGNEITATATVTDEAGNVSLTGRSRPVTKDATAPAQPTSFGVAAGPDNPAGVVTAKSASAVVIQATFAQPPPVDDQITVWVNHHSYSLTPDGDSTTLTIEPPLDLTGLPDGTYKLGMKETDPAGNETPTWTHFTVDTGGAEAPTSVGVPAGPDNPAGYVNAATQTAATIVATFAGPTDPADQITLSVGGVTLATQSGGGDQISWTADLSGLPDGTLPISGTIVDGNGVTSTFSGSLIKDTQAPPAPAVAYVVGPPPNTIKSSDASCVKVFVAFNQAPDPNDVVTVSLSDGRTSAEGSANAGDGHVVVGCIDASSLSAGSISVTGTVTDAAGNSTDFTGTSATLLDCQPSGQGNGEGQSPDQ
jgi:hypothetical protein